MNRGFTLMELLVVMAVMAFLAAASVPAYRLIHRRAQLNSTRTLVEGVAAAIQNHEQRVWTSFSAYVDHDANPDTPKRPGPGATTTTAWLWDLNGDGLLDGTVATSPSATADGPFPAAIIDSGYLGFLGTTRAKLPKDSVNAKGQPNDAWDRPLRFAAAEGTYGGNWFGVWSVGPDGIDGNDDDIASWTARSDK